MKICRVHWQDMAFVFTVCVLSRPVSGPHKLNPSIHPHTLLTTNPIQGCVRAGTYPSYHWMGYIPDRSPVPDTETDNHSHYIASLT